MDGVAGAVGGGRGMSAWSDWRCGALTDDEYKFLYSRERGEDHGEDLEDEWEDEEDEGMAED